jgi:SAM-dependent methyltransferase
MSYGQGFYDTIRSGCQSSAAVVVPLVLDAMDPGRTRTLHVVDVGCGEGWWAQAFAVAGCHVLGIDGDYVTASAIGDQFVAHDLTTSLAPLGITGADLAVSLEVAEHLPASRGSSFVDDLCTLAGAVLFSAAIPGQGGAGHVNERWPDYWVQEFEARDYTVSGALRWKIWKDSRVENWYCVPDDTEILTITGWRLREHLAVGEPVLTYDMVSRSLGWEPLLAVNTFPYVGDLVELAGRWRTTPDHRWPVVTQNDIIHRRGPRMKLARDVGPSDRLVQCADSYRAPEVSVLDARDAAVLGWIVTDGSFLVKTSNGRPQGVIYQSPKKYLEEIVDLLGDEGCPPREDTRPTSHSCATITVRVSLLDRLMAAGFHSKYDLPAVVTRLGPDAVDAMWDAMVKAEGNLHIGSWVFSQVAGPVFDAFQILSLLRGNRVNQVGDKHSIGGTGNGSKSGRTVAAKTRQAVEYEGVVWCPTTPSGTWVMRQRGTAVITGNCQNLLFAARAPQDYPSLFDTPLATPWPVVHPVLYNARRGA